MASQTMNLPAVNQTVSSNVLLEEDTFALTPPPIPSHTPSQEHSKPVGPTHISGNFYYVAKDSTRQMLSTAHHAITQLELWPYMKKDRDSYMMTRDKEVSRIYEKIQELGYYGHSGCSFGWTMRQMQNIAKYGEAQFEADWINNQKQNA